MNTSYTDMVADTAYNEGFEKGVKSMKRKYDNLKAESKYFFQMYESTFGEPDETLPENDFYFKLRKKLFK